MNDNNDLLLRKQFDRDLRRTIILSNYVEKWGIPEYRISRTITTKANEIICCEIYIFPPLLNDNTFFRIATVGISDNFHKNENEVANYELMMTLFPEFGGISLDQVLTYFLYIIASSFSYKERIKEGFILSKSDAAPQKWNQKAILIDTPRSEPEELEYFHFGSQHVNLYIALPIYEDEYNLLLNNGLEVFDDLCELSESSIVDLDRDSFINLIDR